jgi:hypothetical protein
MGPRQTDALGGHLWGSRGRLAGSPAPNRLRARHSSGAHTHTHKSQSNLVAGHKQLGAPRLCPLSVADDNSIFRPLEGRLRVRWRQTRVLPRRRGRSLKSAARRTSWAAHNRAGEGQPNCPPVSLQLSRHFRPPTLTLALSLTLSNYHTPTSTYTEHGGQTRRTRRRPNGRRGRRQ